MDMPVPGRRTFDISDPPELLVPFGVFFLHILIKSPEIFLRFFHVRRSCFFGVGQCDKIVVLLKILQKPVSGFPLLVPLIDLCHLFGSRFLLFCPLLSGCSISSIEVFFSFYHIVKFIRYSFRSQWCTLPNFNSLIKI